MKAIETYYNGYRFRSRLEARWAVFFDKANIKYEYETEGFQFDDGTAYLPDFYLPWFRCYVEIKPGSICGAELEEAERKCGLLFEEKGDCITMLCIGDPYDWNVTVYCNDSTDSSGGSSEWDVDFFEGCWFDGGDGSYSGGKHFISLCVTNNTRDRVYYTGNWEYAPLIDAWKITEYRSDFQYAKIAARQARFEFNR